MLSRTISRRPCRGRGPRRTSQGAEIRYLQVQTTTDLRAEAMELAHDPVAARLAACAQVTGSVASTYWWENGLERAEEWLVMLKLSADQFERHSYDESEIVEPAPE